MDGKELYRGLKSRQFLFEELVKRDFKKKYKGTMLGMAWSLLSPLLNLVVMMVIFSRFFGRTQPHYIIYVFCGNLLYTYFSEATKGGMKCIRENAKIFTKINVPKFIFVVAKNAQTLINFCLTMALLAAFCIYDRIEFSWNVLLLVYPVVTLLLLNIGLGAILAALYTFFKDMQYLWEVSLRLIMWGSAIFYPVDKIDGAAKVLFDYNPLYQHIFYFRQILINGVVPELSHHLFLAGSAVLALAIGGWLYRRYNTEFVYYV